MKRIITLLLVILVQSVSAMDLFYYYQGKQIPLMLSTEKIYVQFVNGKTESEVMQIVTSLPVRRPFEKTLIERPENAWVIELESGKHQSEIASAITSLNKHKDVVIASPFIVSGQGNVFQGITSRFIVKLQHSYDLHNLIEIANKTKTKIVKENEFEPNLFILSADKYSNGNALEMANYFHETGIFEFAEPSFLRIIGGLCSNDEDFSKQWGLKNTGQHNGIVGADIRICEAWDITRGKNVIAIAVLDVGIDLNHPDLIGNLLPGYDATGNGSNGGGSGLNNHGTACAGIIAASGNNNLGISGVAPDSRIIPIKFLSDEGFLDDDIFAVNAINWAWQNGADILSCSWFLGLESNAVTLAINNATTQGRGGLGCPVLFSAGNFNNEVVYPANLPNTISVGAMSMCNQRKRSRSILQVHLGPLNLGVSSDPEGVSCDGEFWWGSSFGMDLDLVAPGVKIATTDFGGGYIDDFNGTSSSCPFAAGVMALILSVNRCLTGEQARVILELSCDKVGGYCYSVVNGRSSGTWNTEMGYGKINAFKAVQFAYSSSITNLANIGNPAVNSVSTTFNLSMYTGCAGIAAATYIVKRHEVIKNVTYPHTEAPIVLGTSNGLSPYNPNDGNHWMDAYNLTPTSATVRTYVYAITNLSGQNVGWIPTSPSNIKFNFSVLSSMQQQVFLQNLTFNNGTQTINAMEQILAGNSVTSALNFGDYVVTGGAISSLQAGNAIMLSPGTIITPNSTGNFHAYVDPFFTCTQFPAGRSYIPSELEEGHQKRIQSINNKISYLVDYRNLNNRSDEMDYSLEKSLVYPNPFSNRLTIEYSIEQSEHVSISLYSANGQELIELKNKAIHQPGSYKIELNDLNFPQGHYVVKISTNEKSYAHKIVKY